MTAPASDRTPDRAAARAIAAGDSAAPLVPASPSPHWSVWPVYRHQGINGALPEVWLRSEVFDRLIVAAHALAPTYRLVLLDGWRPMRVQATLYDRMRSQVAKANPGLDAAGIDRVTLDYAAPPSADPVQPSPHLTGGSVDLSLADADGRLLDMGGRFDEAGERSWTACPMPTAIAARRHDLVHAMVGAGFTNLPSEWWHFDFGTWLWAWYSGGDAAIYGPVDADSDAPSPI